MAGGASPTIFSTPTGTPYLSGVARIRGTTRAPAVRRRIADDPQVGQLPFGTLMSPTRGEIDA
jgi:hypothetical protein